MYATINEITAVPYARSLTFFAASTLLIQYPQLLFSYCTLSFFPDVSDNVY